MAYEIISGSVYDEFSHIIGSGANKTIIEFGANDGTNTKSFTQLFPGARIYAFECDPRAINLWKSKLAGTTATLIEAAVGAADGETEFNVSGGIPPGVDPALYPDGWHLSGSIRKPKRHTLTHPWINFDKKISVPVRSLDSWAKEHGIEAVDFIWADVQGAEGDLIAGGAKIFRKTHYFYTEYSNEQLYEGELDLDGIVAALPDFEVVKVYKNDVLLRNKNFQPL